MLKHVLAIVIIANTLGGCWLVQSPVVRLWTDSAEIAMYVEEYNAARHPFQIELEFLRKPARELSIRSDHPDIVIAEQLASRTVHPFLQDLTRQLEDGSIGRDRFYTALLDLGRSEEKQLALPVSFNLPLVVYYREQGILPDGQFAFTPVELREATAGYNQTVAERFVRMGFSPRWDRRFLTTAALLYGAGFRETAPHRVQWNSLAVDAALTDLRRWVQETNGGSEAEDAFEVRYLYDPELKMLETGRIAAIYGTSDGFFGLEESRRNDFSFAWLWNGETIPVLGTVLYAGIPTGATNRQGASHVLSWLFDPEVQGQLLRSAPQKRIQSFGFAAGFSSLRTVNSDHLIRRYRLLLGATPQEALLRFPQVLPTYWNELASEVISPWMSSTISQETGPQSLMLLVDAWLLTREE